MQTSICGAKSSRAFVAAIHRFRSSERRTFGLDGISDEQVLEWAAQQHSILVTHDRTTIQTFAWERVEAGDSMPGVFILSNSISTAIAIDQLLAIATCSQAEHWVNRVEFLPF